MKPLLGVIVLLGFGMSFAGTVAAQSTLWLAPQAIDSTAAADAAEEYYPELVTDGAGNWIAAWQSGEILGGPLGSDFDILMTRSSDNGATWTAAAPLNFDAATDTGPDFSPNLCTDGTGMWLAVWSSGESFGGTIGPDYDILVATSTDNGSTWTPPLPLNSDAATDLTHDFSPNVATDDAGQWIVVWSTYDDVNGDLDINLSRSTDGESWTTQTPLNTNAATDSGTDTNPHIGTDGQGNWIAVWDSTDSLGSTIGTDFDILVARSTKNGITWSAPAPLNAHAASDSGLDIEPKVVADDSGMWMAVWRSNDSVGGTIGADYDILSSRSTDNGETWMTAMPVNTFATFDSSYEASCQVATNRAGLWVVIYSSTNTLSGSIGSDPDILISRSKNGGASWSSAAIVNTSATTDSSNDDFPALATDAHGHWIAAWSSDDTLAGTIGSDNDIIFTRATDSDDDGVSDSSETSFGTDPNSTDTDQDLLDDNEELTVYSTDPLDADTDDDGVLDGIEIALGTDPLDPFDFPLLPVSRLWLLALIVVGVAAVALRRRVHSPA